jgi:hypothetical protein
MNKDKIRCKERVSNKNSWGLSGCARYAVTDGYCKQHHPDSVKERRDQSIAMYKYKRDRDPLVLAHKKITELMQRIADLEKLVAK